MEQKTIIIKGAKTHNLKNINLEIPRNKFVVITGVSGSGKSSLAFDTIYAEGQRRYVESLSAYARQFLNIMDKPEVDSIDGLSPAISIEQKTRSNNPRSTVGTITEIYDYLRLLFARVGVPYSIETGLPIEAQTIDNMVDRISELKQGTKFYLLAPVIRDRKGEHKTDLLEYKKQGFQRVMVDDIFYEIDEVPNLERYEKHTIAVVVDRLSIPANEMLQSAWRTRLVASLEIALRLADGIVWIKKNVRGEQEKKLDEGKEGVGQIGKEFNKLFSEDMLILSEKFACPVSGFSIEEIEPRLFSFNNPQGACSVCGGLGIENKFDPHLIIDWSYSIKQGAIKCLTDESLSIYRIKHIREYYQALIEALAKQFNFSINVPFKNLSKKDQDIILYGSGEVPVPISVYDKKNKEYKFNKPFEGVINILNRRFQETLDNNHLQDLMASMQKRSECSECKGARLKKEALCVKINGLNIADVASLSIKDGLRWIETLKLSVKNQKIGERVIQEIRDRYGFLNDVGLGYLTLSRNAGTLSGGESQRIRLASQIGSGLMGVLYVLDEPSIGLHQRDNDKLLATLKHLRDLGNSVIVVEHDEDAILSADWVIDIGPLAGIFGGEVIANGTLEDLKKASNSLTADYIFGRRRIEVPEVRRFIDPRSLYKKVNKSNSFKSKKQLEGWRGVEDKKEWGMVNWLKVEGAKVNNLKNIDAYIPLGRFVCITGVSGSGKSSLILESLSKNLINKLQKLPIESSLCSDIVGIENIDKIIEIDQTPIGRTPRSNPATYVGFFSDIREWFANLPESKARGYTSGRFSFNMKGGRCEACQGDGVIKIEMHFLSDVYVECEHCRGKRYNKETLSVKYKDKSISDILNMTIEEGVDFFTNHSSIWNKLKKLKEVGLGYLLLGHSSTLLSGGEAQRVKLAKELCRRSTGKTLYILDEPTTGLHFEDVRKLLEILNRLVDQGNSVVVIEHNLDVIKIADWIIDIGPEGGVGGGEIIAQGTPENIANEKNSYTGMYLKKHLLL